VLKVMMMMMRHWGVRVQLEEQRRRQRAGGKLRRRRGAILRFLMTMIFLMRKLHVMGGVKRQDCGGDGKSAAVKAAAIGESCWEWKSAAAAFDAIGSKIIIKHLHLVACH